MHSLSTVRCRALLGVALIMAPQIASSDLTVILDHPQARPLSDFLQPASSPKVNTDLVEPATRALGAADIDALLPVRSLGLSPGPVTTRAHTHPFAQPFFLIGSDELSRQWLVRYRERLKAIGAVGMLVEADTIEDLETMAELARGLSITPASGTDIARALGITHYPVCIDTTRIWQ